MSYKAAIFDLDGTLLNTLTDLHAAVNVALQTHGLPKRSLNEVRSYLGNGIKRLIHLAIPSSCSSQLEAEVFETFRSYYLQHSADHTQPYPGINDLLAALRAKNVRIAVVSNKADAAVQDLVKHYFPKTFSFVVGERSGVRRKPYPDTVQAVMHHMDLTPDDIVYIGDSEVDVETAQNCGCDAIVVSWGFRDRSYLETLSHFPIVDTTAELLDTIIS